MKQISSEELGVALPEATTGFRSEAATNFSIREDNNEVAAAEIAALVPIFRASRRLKLILIWSFFRRLEGNNIIGRLWEVEKKKRS
jgi:hypothetical protein